jgi:quercetin dioxygenase-like cupin family protein
LEYVFNIDESSLAGAESNVAQVMYDRGRGAEHCSVMWVYTPPGGGSPAGLHTHGVDQLFYIIDGHMEIEVDQQTFTARAGSLVVFPAGVPHRNWNAGDTPTRHLSIAAPLPPSGRPFATPVVSPDLP